MNNETNTPVAESGRPKDVTGRIETEIRTYDLLDSLNIPYMRFDHEAAFTIDACTGADEVLGIHICKNLFLCNRQQTAFYLLTMPGDKPFHTKDLSAQIGSSRLSFAPPEKMEEILEEKNRAAAGPTIPARGLTLVSLEYEKELAPYLEGENKHWHYVLDQRNVPEKGLAYLTIERCEPEELDGVLRRVIHQAYRNGAKQVFVRDTFGEEGSIYGYYRLRRQPEVEEGWLEAIYEGEHQ